MKKVTFLMALAAGAALASCSQSPKADLKTDVDTLSYAIGMARTEGLDQYLLQQGVDSTQMADFMRGFIDGSAKIDGKDNAYVIGLQIGQMVSKQWVEGFNRQIFDSDSLKTVSRKDMLAGFIAGVTKNYKVMHKDSAQYAVQNLMESVRNNYLTEKYADNKAAGEKYLAENKEKEGVVTTPTGLQYKIITEGKGAIPGEKDQVQINYRGTLIDGTEFDSSAKRKDKDGNPIPASMRVNQVIKGWSEALQMMPEGSKWELAIPYDLAYGNRESGALIKPFSALLFEVELVKIGK
ncbi:MAG: FKBP-type peptidyl-prolyl cis-trans isomerase [Prevotellaceae bacterium]|nr:FKBP-type peptidyl-prolyl cis-trans isomerase [Prevotellaceae bacterium]